MSRSLLILVLFMGYSVSAYTSTQAKKIFPDPQCDVELSIDKLLIALETETPIKSSGLAPLGGDLPWPGVDGKWDELKWINAKKGILVNVNPKLKKINNKTYETESLDIYFYAVCDVNALKPGEKPSSRAKLSIKTQELIPHSINQTQAKSSLYQIRVNGVQGSTNEDFRVKITPVKITGEDKIHIVIYKANTLTGAIMEINHNFYLEQIELEDDMTNP